MATGTDPDEGRVVPDHRSGVVDVDGGDGYDFLAANQKAGWVAVPDWGRDGWDLGRWPLTMVMVNDDYDRPRALVYIEGDVDVREFSTTTSRDQYLDGIAEGFWRSGEADGPKDITAYGRGSLPDEYRGAPAHAAAAPAIPTHAPTAAAPLAPVAPSPGIRR